LKSQITNQPLLDVCQRSNRLEEIKMNFDFITTMFAAVKPVVSPVWVKCEHLFWGPDSQVKLRPDSWLGKPFPDDPDDDAFMRSWNRDPWILANPCAPGSVVKGTLAPVSKPDPATNIGTGNTLAFKPDGMPALTGCIWPHNYRDFTTVAPPGWKSTLRQDYSALLDKLQLQKPANLQ